MIANIEKCQLIVIELEKREIEKMLKGREMFQYVKNVSEDDKDSYKVLIYCCDSHEQEKD